MQLIKQLVTKGYQKYLTHDMNKRFFPEEFYSSWAMAAVVMQIEHGLDIDAQRVFEINKLYQKLHKEAVSKTFDSVKRSNFKDDKEYFKALQKQLRIVQSDVIIKLKQLISEDVKVINKFLDVYKDVTVREEGPNFKRNIPGVVGMLGSTISYRTDRPSTRH